MREGGSRAQGGQTHYGAQPEALPPPMDWIALSGAFWHDRLIASRRSRTGWTNDQVRRRPSPVIFGLDRLDCRGESHHLTADSRGCGRGGSDVLRRSGRPGCDFWQRAMVRGDQSGRRQHHVGMRICLGGGLCALCGRRQPRLLRAQSILAASGFRSGRPP